MKMQFDIKKLPSGLWAVIEKESKKFLMVCNCACNADLIANILAADEDLENARFIKVNL